MKKALILLAEGAEEIETVVVADILTRGNVKVTIASVDKSERMVKCSRNVVVQANVCLHDVKKEEVFDVVVLPGGLQGSFHLSQCKLVGEFLKKQEEQGGLIAAICAAPTALAAHKIAGGKTITSYPSFKQQLTEAGYRYSDEEVVVDGTLITSQGPATAFAFSLCLLRLMQGDQVAVQVQDQLLWKR